MLIDCYRSVLVTGEHVLGFKVWPQSVCTEIPVDVIVPQTPPDLTPKRTMQVSIQLKPGCNVHLQEHTMELLTF